jgi:hypothetical protein
MKPTSDVDLALVTSRESLAAVEAAAQEIAETARDRFGTRLNVLVGSPSLERLSKSRQPGQGVWRAIEREGLDVFARGLVAKGKTAQVRRSEAKLYLDRAVEFIEQALSGLESGRNDVLF